MSEREAAGMDKAALTAELAAIAGDASGAEAVLARLAAALFPAGGGRLEHMTWGAAADGGEPTPVALASQRDDGEARVRAAELRYRTLIEQIPAVTFMAVLGEGENEVKVHPDANPIARTRSIGSMSSTSDARGRRQGKSR